MTRTRWILALAIGLAGALGIAALGYLNDRVIGLNYLVGNHLPISVFGLLVVVVILINPLLGLISPAARLSRAQLGLAVTMMLVACSVPGGGMMRTFVSGLSAPWRLHDQQPGWQNAELMERYLPGTMLVPPDEDVLDPLQVGLAAGGDGVRPVEVFTDGRIPWGKWLRPLGVWLPILLLTNLGIICLSLLVHPQWAHREHLRYPIASFATTLLGRDGAGGTGSLLRNRLFWLGLAPILAIHIVNGIWTWHPGFLHVPMEYDLYAVPQHWTYLSHAVHTPPGVWTARIFPAVIAFAFFLASDVAFGVGISQFLPVLITPILVLNDVETTIGWLEGGTLQWQVIGSYLAMGLMLVYAGRRYYADALRSAVTFRRRPGLERYSVWAMRGLLACMGGLVAMLTFGLGLDWPFAALLAMLLCLAFTVMARLNAEAGLFFVGHNWYPITFLSGLFGAYALGPQAYLVVAFATIILIMDPRESLMPFMVTGLKLAEDVGVRPSRVGAIAPVVLVLAVAVALPVVVWANYNFGAPSNDSWAVTKVPSQPFQETSLRVQELKNEGLLAESEELSTSQRVAEGLWGSHHPKRGTFLWAVGIGVVLVLATSVLRMRFHWWPLHPILFLVWISYQAQMFATSFLIGWAIRVIVQRLGGQPAYRAGRMLMVGVIAGDLLGGLTFMIVGAMYYAVTGVTPPRYAIFPT